MQEDFMERYVDELDIVSAIWILASNDENSTITFEGIRHRLDLPDIYDVRGVVKRHPELFRGGVPETRLETWKQEMLLGKHLPSWIRDTESEELRKARIEALSVEDVFRSQFRAGAKAPRSPMEIIDWGLQHIDRLRKVGIEAREQKVKKWTSLWIPILSSIIALAAVLSGAYVQTRSINTQVELKRYEVTFRTKQESYAAFMKYLFEAFDAASKRDSGLLVMSLDKIETTYFAIEPVIKTNERDEIWQKYQEFAAFCLDLKKKMQDSQITIDEESVKTFTDYRGYFRSKLFEALFVT